MTPTLAINLATRGRPHLLKETVERTLPNIKLADTCLMISVDEDDQPTIDALKDLPSDKRIMPVVKEREDSVGAKYNRVLLYAHADVYLTMVDYAPHVTPGFDAKILEAASVFPDGIGVVYNHLANATFPGINAVTHGLAEKMGGIYPTHFPYWFIDHWLDDIARTINRISFADVRIDTTRQRERRTHEYREPEFWTNLFDVLHLERRRIAHSIIEAPEFADPPWRKELSLRHHPLIEARSFWVNAVVRAETVPDIGPPDERYLRLRAAAQKIASVAIAEHQTILAGLTREAA